MGRTWTSTIELAKKLGDLGSEAHGRLADTRWRSSCSLLGGGELHVESSTAALRGSHGVKTSRRAALADDWRPAGCGRACMLGAVAKEESRRSQAANGKPISAR